MYSFRSRNSQLSLNRSGISVCCKTWQASLFWFQFCCANSFLVIFFLYSDMIRILKYSGISIQENRHLNYQSLNVWGCSKIETTLDLPKNKWILGTKITNKQKKETSSSNHNQLVLSTMHTVKTVKIVFCVSLLLLFFFFSSKAQTKRHNVGTDLSDFGVFEGSPTMSFTKWKACLSNRTSHPLYFQCTLGTCCPPLFLFLSGWSNQELSESSAHGQLKLQKNSWMMNPWMVRQSMVEQINTVLPLKLQFPFLSKWQIICTYSLHIHIYFVHKSSVFHHDPFCLTGLWLVCLFIQLAESASCGQ